MNLDRMFQVGVTLAVIGVTWSVWPQPGEAAYNSVKGWRRPAYHHGPAVLLDRGHWNRSTADPGFEGLRQLLARDGYRVSRNHQELVVELLRTTRVLVIADAMGWKGALQSAAHSVGIDMCLRPQAFAPQEVTAVRDWVNGGGSLLLIADRAPSGEASQALASAFGAHLADCPSSDGRTVIRFDRDGGLGGDVISAGRAEAGEQVTFAVSFGGGNLTGPAGSTTFLAIAPKSVFPAERDSRCVPENSQGVAFEAGRGRVVLLTAQLARTEGLAQKVGIDDRLADNRQLVLNIMHWLSGAPSRTVSR
jgi:hypothetical protein